MATTSIPLPKKTTGYAFASGNQGLYFNKFFNQWTYDFSETNGNAKGFLNGKMSWIMSHVHGEVLNGRQCRDDKPAHNRDKSAGNQTLLDDANDRIARLCKNLHSKPHTYITTGPFITGMGMSHPIENGFLWHHTLGVPYLPGSSIKGMIRAWLRDWCGVEKGEDGYDEHIDEVTRLFGGPIYETFEDENGKKNQKEIREASAGNIIVFDALPTKPVELYHEVMTPHDGGWRVADKPTEKDAPADWISPVPIPFLAVEAGAEFQFALAARKGAKDKDLDHALNYLEMALEWIGAGAKTAVGFGRFKSVILIAKEIEEAEQNRQPILSERVEILEGDHDTKFIGRTGLINKLFPPPVDRAQISPDDDKGRIKGTFALSSLKRLAGTQ